MKKRVYMVCVILIVVWGTCCSFSANTEQSELANSYYFYISNDGSETVKFKAEPKSALLIEAVEHFDQSNLEFYKGEVYNCLISFEVDHVEQSAVENGIRESLLRSGYAKLQDESIASETELAAQDYAKNTGKCFWADETGLKKAFVEIPASTAEDTIISNNEEMELHFIDNAEKPIEKNQDLIEEKTTWLREHILEVIGALWPILVFLAAWIHKKKRTIKRKIFLIGAEYSGRSALLSFLRDPTIDREELLNPEHVSETVVEPWRYEDSNYNLYLDAEIVNIYGGNSLEVIDQLKHKRFGEKYVLIFIMAPRKEHDIRNHVDSAYVNEQYTFCKEFWNSFLEAGIASKPRTVIMFVNKSDLFDDPRQLDDVFQDHKELIKNFCKKIREKKFGKFYYMRGSVVNKDIKNKMRNAFIK